MGRYDKIDKLFQKWPKEGIHKFERDGIVDEEEWNRQKVKVLYVLKEPHDPPVEGVPFEEIDKREFYFNGAFDGEKEYPETFRLLSKWCYGISEGFPPWFDLNDEDFNSYISRSPWFRKAAIINIKKYGGYNTSPFPLIRQYADEHQELLKRQIELIEPDFVVGCGLDFVAPIIIHHIFSVDDFETLDCKTGLNVWKHKNLAWPLVDWYHPQAPGIKHEFLYTKLIETLKETLEF